MAQDARERTARAAVCTRPRYSTLIDSEVSPSAAATAK